MPAATRTIPADLVQTKDEKDQANGYPGLDDDGGIAVPRVGAGPEIPDDGVFFVARPPDHTTNGAFRFTLFDGASGDAARPVNAVMRMGFNVAKGGGTAVSGRAGVAYAIESHYMIGGVSHTEIHPVQYFPADGGTELRVLSVVVNDATKAVRFDAKSDEVYFADRTGTNFYARMVSGGTTTSAGGAMEFDGAAFQVRRMVNNSGFLYQRNAAGTQFVSLMYLNNADQVDIGSASNLARMRGGAEINSTNGLTLHASAGVFPVSAPSSTGGVRFGASSSDKIAFWGGTPAARPTVTGSRGSGAATADLLSKLAAMGLITDGTTA